MSKGQKRILCSIAGKVLYKGNKSEFTLALNTLQVCK